MANTARAGKIDQVADIDLVGDEVKRLATPKAMREALAQARTVAPTWHVVRNVHEHEARARECLKRSGFEVYYPQLIEMRPTPMRFLSRAQRASKLKVMQEVAVPLFQRYVFVRFSRASNWQEIFGALGLLGVLCDGNDHKPCPFPDAVIAAMKACADPLTGAIPGKVTLQQLALAIGDQVRVTEGAFAGFDATVMAPVSVPLSKLDDSQRVELLVALFGRQTPVDLPLSAVEKV